MKAFLLYRHRDLDLERQPSPGEAALIQDLELATLFGAMARGDKVLFEVASKVVLAPLETDVTTILYRQQILADCLRNAAIVRDIYDIAVEAIEREKKTYFGLFRDHPETVLRRSVEVVQIFVGLLKRLRDVADRHAAEFTSDGFITLFAMLRRELDDDYFASIDAHLKRLKFRGGILVSGRLGKGCKAVDYVLRRPRDRGLSWLERIFARNPPGYTLQIHPRDEAGGRALSELRDRGLGLAANALAQSAEHILGFFQMLRTELAFYLGCVNLHGELDRLGEPTCFPRPEPTGRCTLSCTELYDVCLALSMKRKAVGNDVAAEDKRLVFITGANQGGKSTFLRSVGLAQLMMQNGMSVPSRAFAADVVDGLFTHYRHEEDASMRSGKFDEELARMSGIVDAITAHPMLLFNESFAATNEREGAEIARQILDALLERPAKAFFVTHMYELAHSFFERHMDTALFLRAERREDGGRTFRLREGEPLRTSFGEDLYREIFGAGATAQQAAGDIPDGRGRITEIASAGSR
jgi:hypothetical protein